MLQGGFSTGAGHRDLCDVWAALPELTVTAGTCSTVSACKVDEDWQMNWRGLVTYTIPKIDVLISGILRSQANTEPLTIETGVATNGVGTRGELHRDAGGPRGQRPDAVCAWRDHADGQPGAAVLALRRSGELGGHAVRQDPAVRQTLEPTSRSDLYNMFNSNVGTAFNQGFGADGATWLRPTAVLNPRFARFNVTFDF